MNKFIIIIPLLFASILISHGQNSNTIPSFKKHDIVWSAGLFKSWLEDHYIGFDKIGDNVNPVFTQQKKMGIAIQSHYMYKAVKWFGIGGHLGLGLDLNSSIKAPVVLFGGSLSIGNKHQCLINFGWADGKRRIVPNSLKEHLLNSNYTEIPQISDRTELNTGLYMGLSYRFY